MVMASASLRRNARTRVQRKKSTWWVKCMNSKAENSASGTGSASSGASRAAPKLKRSGPRRMQQRRSSEIPTGAARSSVGGNKGEQRGSSKTERQVRSRDARRPGRKHGVRSEHPGSLLLNRRRRFVQRQRDRNARERICTQHRRRRSASPRIQRYEQSAVRTH